ncbi:hypothetical protein N7517_000589 [Penicillium concentricum]|uniref:Uncharacterized protein n=1 Tax=Penicillium concentricum TaxID=293559 RepID=A0A9W9SUC5_9EURO|nr:uncharacterized protein N7517_000589 [Penicillium concentricum]KAJ5382678.1 hypothetical protein N7517_000589 [Penicillium concentricum]
MAPVPNDESGSTPEKPTELAAEILGSCASDIVGRWIKNCYTRAKSSLNTMRLKKARTDGAEPQNAVIMKLQYIPPPQSTHATTLPTPVPPVYK